MWSRQENGLQTSFSPGREKMTVSKYGMEIAIEKGDFSRFVVASSMSSLIVEGKELLLLRLQRKILASVVYLQWDHVCSVFPEENVSNLVDV